MQQSENISDLAAALAIAQGQMQAAPRSRTNPYFQSAYSTLADVWDACRGPLSENGLAVVQTMEPSSSGSVAITTTLTHSSGQWISGTLQLTPTKTDPQGMGSAITYARRYSLAAIVGLCSDDDDDGCAASTPSQRSPEAGAAPAKPSRAPSATPSTTTARPAPTADPAAEQSATGSRPPPTGADIITEVVVSKEGDNKSGHWKLYEIKTEAGDVYKTFDGTLADQARMCSLDKCAVVLRYEADKYNARNLKGLTRQDRIPEHEGRVAVTAKEVSEQQLEAGGKPFTLYRVQTSHGEFVTDDKRIADLCIAACADGGGTLDIAWKETGKGNRQIVYLEEIPF